MWFYISVAYFIFVKVLKAMEHLPEGIFYIFFRVIRATRITNLLDEIASFYVVHDYVNSI